MTNFQDRVTQFNALVADFQYEAAHDQFYHINLVKHENEGAPTIGLDNHRAEMRVFLRKISNASAQLLHLVVSDDVSVAEWHYQFDHADWGPKDFKQVSVQRWKDGLIVHERHHYKT